MAYTAAYLQDLVLAVQRLGLKFPLLPQEPLKATVKRWKLARFGDVTRHNSLSKTILHGTLESGQH